MSMQNLLFATAGKMPGSLYLFGKKNKGEVMEESESLYYECCERIDNDIGVAEPFLIGCIAYIIRDRGEKGVRQKIKDGEEVQDLAFDFDRERYFALRTNYQKNGYDFNQW